jgi:hypothetical protein
MFTGYNRSTAFCSGSWNVIRAEQERNPYICIPTGFLDQFVRYHEKMPEPITGRQKKLYKIIRLAHLILNLKKTGLTKARWHLVEEQHKYDAEEKADPFIHLTSTGAENMLRKCSVDNAQYSVNTSTRDFATAKSAFSNALAAYNDCSGFYAGCPPPGSSDNTYLTVLGAVELRGTSAPCNTDYEIYKDLYTSACELALLPGRAFGGSPKDLKPSTAQLVDVESLLAEPHESG